MSTLRWSFLLSLSVLCHCTAPAAQTPSDLSAPSQVMSSPASPSSPTEISFTGTIASDALNTPTFSTAEQAERDAQTACNQQSPGLFISGLSPNPPVGYCTEQQTPTADDLRGDPGIPTVGFPSVTRIGVLQAGTLQQVGTFSELKALYAPVESPEEALAFALLKNFRTQRLTDDTFKSNLPKAPDQVTFATETIEGTRIVGIGDGSYSVTNVLFDDSCASMGRFDEVFAVDYRVEANGDVTETDKRLLYTVQCSVRA